MANAHNVGSGSDMTDFAHGVPAESSPLSQSIQRSQPPPANEDADDSAYGSGVRRSDSAMSNRPLTPSRHGTLKKKQSLRQKNALARSGSRKGSRPGSIKSVETDSHGHNISVHRDEMNSAFFTPVPTTGSPTEILANRFQAWRKILKDLITYFRDIQKGYENRSKSLQGISNIINNTSIPPVFLTDGGIGDATHILRDYHKLALASGNKAKSIEDDVIVQLTGLRSDLQQKIKEIKSLSGDFKNSVDKETEATRRAVRGLQEALGVADSDPSAASGKGDPFIVKLAVERQLERQIEEENYLHRAFLNLETSGRELESIVVGEIQKAYNAYANILKKEADEAYEAVERLQSGPIAMAKDHEWEEFVKNNEHFVDPRLPVRKAEHIYYPGKDNPKASEIRSGMLERKSKYLKSYTPGWYVLSPTHLHEFKSADRIATQTPIMSLNLAEQKLGSQSSADSASHKFMLKGRQTGGIHRGHAWVFRAESRDTMQAWIDDIRNLTEKSGAERNAFLRQHARSVSAGSHKVASISSDGMDEDPADEVPYSGVPSHVEEHPPAPQNLAIRPNPGGRFPSTLSVNRDLQVPLSPSSGESFGDRDVVATAENSPGNHDPFGQQVSDEADDARFRSGSGSSAGPPAQRDSYVPVAQQQSYNNLPVQPGQNPVTARTQAYDSQSTQARGQGSQDPNPISYSAVPPHIQQQTSTPPSQQQRPPPVERHDSSYGKWMGPAAAGAGGAAAGMAGSEIYHSRKQQWEDHHQSQEASQPEGSAYQAEPVRPHTTNTAVSPVPNYPNNAAVDQSLPTVSVPGVSEMEGAVPHQSAPETASVSSAILRTGSETQKLGGETPYQRPFLESHLSNVQTISDLHIPGEFPKAPAS